MEISKIKWQNIYSERVRERASKHEIHELRVQNLHLDGVRREKLKSKDECEIPQTLGTRKRAVWKKFFG